MSRFVPHAIFAGITLAALAVSGAGALATPLPDGQHDYNAPAFLIRHSWVKFAHAAGEPFRDDLSRAEEDATVGRYLELNRLIRAADTTAGDPATAAQDATQANATAAQYRDERAQIENSVERIFEGRLTRIIKEAGLTRRTGSDVVWPPVAIEFEEPPAVLVESPRDEISRRDESLLKSDLTAADVQAIEAQAEQDGETSALVVNIGGIATYPAIIPPSANYQFLMDDIAHEWMHHYLFFTPLGRGYGRSAKLTTLNETVANLVGRELGALLVAAYPLAQSATTAAPAAPPSQGAPAIDFTAEMRGLRRDVEALLAAGDIDDAERVMNEKRDFLAVNGFYLRRINQAYFAFHGSYADTPGSIDPIGPKLDRLRAGSDTLRVFVERARALTSEDALDAEVGATP